MAHAAWHDLLHASAAAVLVVGGSLVLVAALVAHRREATAPAASSPPPNRPATMTGTAGLTILASVLSLAAGAIHLAAAPGHRAEAALLGWGFVAVAAFQVGWALAVAIHPTRTVMRVGLAVNLGVVAVWAWSRTAGLPAGPLAGTPEPIGTPDAVATTLELLLVAILGTRLGGREARLVGRVRHAGAATIALVPAVGAVFLATTLAVSLALGHSHEGAPHADAHSGSRPIQPHAGAHAGQSHAGDRHRAESHAVEPAVGGSHAGDSPDHEHGDEAQPPTERHATDH